MAEIEIKALSKRWGETVGVDNIDLHIADEEFIVLLGPSGCGKTTTMRMIAGLTELSEGEIFIDGQNVNDVDARDRDVAMVFQSYALYPNMTIYENIRFPLRMRNVPKKEQDALIREAARKVQIEPLLERKPSVLSGGQRQRAALARALVRKPRAFLMDEPLSNLDAKLRSSMRVQLKHLQKDLKITTVYVTHDQVEAMTLADRIVVMNDSRIQQVGTPDEIYNNPNNSFVAGFIGSPPMNLISGTLTNGVLTTGEFTVNGIKRSDSDSIQIGMRPEDITTSNTNGTESVHFRGTLYGIEPMGDITILTLQCGDHLLEIKEFRTYRKPLGERIDAYIDNKNLFYFDHTSGDRIISHNN